VRIVALKELTISNLGAERDVFLRGAHGFLWRHDYRWVVKLRAQKFVVEEIVEMEMFVCAGLGLNRISFVAAESAARKFLSLLNFRTTHGFSTQREDYRPAPIL
jgi:hypothetical protein